MPRESLFLLCPFVFVFVIVVDSVDGFVDTLRYICCMCVQKTEHGLYQREARKLASIHTARQNS